MAAAPPCAAASRTSALSSADATALLEFWRAIALIRTLLSWATQCYAHGRFPSLKSIVERPFCVLLNRKIGNRLLSMTATCKRCLRSHATGRA